MNTIIKMSQPPVIAFISDFGSEDSYAGAVRGVLAGIASEARVVDISHAVPPGDVRRAAILLWEVQPYFPKGTIFLVVVDPGVGSSRRAAILQFADGFVVGPDNGLTTFLAQRYPDWSAVEITKTGLVAWETSRTFHGRDVFAPAAGLLSRGVPITEFGKSFTPAVILDLPVLKGDPDEGWEGEILYADHFGNLVTSIGKISPDRDDLIPWLNTGALSGSFGSHARIRLADGTILPLSDHYEEGAAPGTLMALVGGNGLLEICARQSRASNRLAGAVGARVFLIPER